MTANIRGDMVECCVCRKYTRAIHWHHTVPRSLGGTLSLQIPLDGDCHTALHNKASALCSFLRGNRKKPVGQYWGDPDHEQSAQHWLQILVESMMNPPVSAEDKMTLLPAITVDVETRAALELLKRDLPGVTNIYDTILFCMEFTLKSKGYKNDRHQNKNKNKRIEGSNQKRTNLW